VVLERIQEDGGQVDSGDGSVVDSHFGRRKGIEKGEGERTQMKEERQRKIWE